MHFALIIASLFDFNWNGINGCYYRFRSYCCCSCWPRLRSEKKNWNWKKKLVSYWMMPKVADWSLCSCWRVHNLFDFIKVCNASLDSIQQSPYRRCRRHYGGRWLLLHTVFLFLFLLFFLLLPFDLCVYFLTFLQVIVNCIKLLQIRKTILNLRCLCPVRV